MNLEIHEILTPFYYYYCNQERRERDSNPRDPKRSQAGWIFCNSRLAPYQARRPRPDAVTFVTVRLRITSLLQLMCLSKRLIQWLRKRKDRKYFLCPVR